MGVSRGMAAAALGVAIATASGHASAVQRAGVPDASRVLAAAREALGGEKNLAAVKTFTATGRTRQIRGANLVPIEFEINCELPARFVRRDDSPAQDTDISVSGFDGETLIQFPTPPRPGGAAPNPAPQRLVAAKQDFARLTVGVFAASFPTYPLMFQYVAEGEAPEGKADVLDVIGPGNFSARLVIPQATHLPAMLMWQGPAPGQRKPVELRMYYADYRDVSGIKWPFRIRRAIGGETIEEMVFDRVRINAKVDPKKFEAPK